MRKYPLFLALLSTLFLASCGGGKDEITLEVRLVSGDQLVQPSSPIFKGDTAIQFDLFHFYLSQLTLGDALAEEVMFVNIEDSATTNYTLALDKRVSTMSFGLGVDSLQNVQDPALFDISHPLSSANAMYWTWASKYRFVKADGRVNYSGTLGTDDEFLVWHTGTNSLYRTLTFDTEIRPGDHVVLTFDLGQMLENISIKDNLFTHANVATYDIAERITEEMVSAATISVD